MTKKSKSLPPLVFGEAKAEVHFDVRSLGDRVKNIFPGLNAYDPVGAPQHFLAKSSIIELPKLKVVSSTISPSIVDREGKQEMTLLIPLSGQCQLTIDSQSFDWGAGRSGVFMPEFDGRALGCGDTRSLLMFQLDRGELERIARTMSGLAPDASIDLKLDEARQTPMSVAGCHIEPVLRKLANVIELYHSDPSILFQLGIDEILYRHIVGLLCPNLLISEQSQQPGRKVKPRSTDGICDVLLSNLGRRWTLTDMTQISGLSIRTLQYAFQMRFGCSPMSWLREQRLQRAHCYLLANDFNSITELAQDCGFGSASLFASYYKSRFGVLPSKAMITD